MFSKYFDVCIRSNLCIKMLDKVTTAEQGAQLSKACQDLLFKVRDKMSRLDFSIRMMIIFKGFKKKKIERHFL